MIPTFTTTTTLLLASSAFAADHFVNISSGPYTTIQSAINAAAPGDRVLIQDDGSDTDYLEDIDFLGKDIIVRNDPANLFKVAIVGTGTGPVVTMDSGEPPTAELSGLIVKNGVGAAPHYAGGGIFMNNSAGRLVDLFVCGSRADLGGGIAILRSQAELANVTVHDNNAPITGFYGVQGGGVYAYRSSVRLKGGRIVANRAMLGGGLMAHQSRLEMVNVGLEGNEAEEGGGLHLGTSGYPALIEACVFIQNLATASSTRPALGGGAFVYDSRSTFESCVFDGNQSTGSGGNFCARDAEAHLYDSSLFSGMAYDGAGLLVQRARVRTERCHFSNNNAANLGGGAALRGRSSTLESLDSVYDMNTADRGGAIAARNDTDLLLDHCDVIQNLATFGGGIYSHGNNGRRVVNDCRIHSNDAARHGGGIAIFGSVIFDVIATGIENNRAVGDGAGIWAHTANLTLDNCICCYNSAGGTGGGIRSRLCTPTVRNSTVSNNTPSDISGAFLNIASSIGSGC